MTVPAQAQANLSTPASTIGRYGQLLYASFDDGRSGGGWQVKDETGELSPTERDELVARIVTTFDVGPPLPQFPTPDELALRPARLYYAPMNTVGSSTAYWHTVDAGNDATGRPGNVMAHVLLDREVTATSGYRPIQLWNSADWCRPYGAAEVLSSALANRSVPQPNPYINARAAVDFLADMQAVERQTVFRVLLDGVYRAMTGGPTVALQVADYADVPRWIAAVSFFMSPGTAHRFSWSTHDNPQQVLADSRRGVHLVCVLRPNADELSHGGVVVLDEADQPNIGELGGTHTTQKAQILVTAWSVLAEGVLSDDDLAVRLIERQDAIAAEAGDRGLSPAWPLAVAVQAEPDLAEFHSDAQMVVAEESPADVGAAGWLRGQVAAAIAATAPAEVGDAVVRLQRAVERDAGVQRAAGQLLRMLLDNPQRVDDIDLRSIPRCAAIDLGPHMLDVARFANGLNDGGSRPPMLNVRSGLRFAELLHRLGFADVETGAAIVAVGAGLAPVGAGFLADPAAAAALVREQDLSPYVREVAFRPVVAQAPAVWDSLDLVTWRWLFGEDRCGPEELGAPLANPQPEDRVLYPLYVRVLIAEARGVVPAGRLREAAQHAVFFALDAPQIADGHCRRLVSVLNRTALLDAPELTRAFQEWPNRISPSAAMMQVCYRDVDGELLVAVGGPPAAEHATPADRQARAAAQLRWVLHVSDSALVKLVEDCLADAAPTLFEGLNPDRLTGLAPDLAVAMGAVFITAQSRGLSWADPSRPVVTSLRSELRRESERVVSVLLGFADAGLVEGDWFAAQSFLAHVDPDLAAPSVLNGDEQRGGGYVARVLANLAIHRMYDGPRDATELRDICWPTVRSLSADQAERFFHRYLKASRDWLGEQQRRTRR